MANGLIGGYYMDRLNEHSYIWESDKDRYVLLKDNLEYDIFYINEKELMFFLIEDDTLADLIVNKMLENGNKVYNSIEELQEAINSD
ncbi:MAG: hypothetical protein HDR71_08450 [Lachnospiraceae bacterium]|nr:hypothetical protein [Lachnospiraceae bacterium]